MSERNASVTGSSSLFVFVGAQANEQGCIDPLIRRNLVASPVTPPEYEFSYPVMSEQYDLFAPSQMPVTTMDPVAYGPYGPYEIDVKTERQTYINDVPLRHDSSISTFSSFAPPQLDAVLPTFPGDEWLQDDCFTQIPTLEGIDPALCDSDTAESYTTMQSNIPVSDQDRPLLDHFIHNVMRLIFPVLEAHQQGQPRAQTILRALETNKCYLHCCLSVAAIHLKTTVGIVSEQIDHDIMRHRYEAVSQLCQALGQDVDHEEILDATLAMIFFHCSVGPADDYLPDIPWFDHFQAASNLVNRLGLPTEMLSAGSPYMSSPPFNMTLAAWIDILGSTMQGTTPQFAHTYRSKHLSGSSSGLRELMGCDDRVMYLISEIACLDALRASDRIDSMAVCSHVSALGQQLEFTEPADQALEHPYSPTTGAIRTDVLTKNMTRLFRIAARIYLCSLVPGFDRNQPSTVNLVSAFIETLNYIPTGPTGFDRSLVWPLLITGSFSSPGSEFRTILAQRAASLEEHAELGSFGRMYRLLQEVWRQADELEEPVYMPEELYSNLSEGSGSGSASPVAKLERSASPENAYLMAAPKQTVSWREVMQRNGWHYLLI